jgi:aspartyl-tRNA(Asn)/glutamyl-tRNA(Gln) amidotransferase subunit A
VILFGSETLSTDNYMKVYDKALRVRRVIKEAFDALFAEYDAVLLPAVSQMTYTPNTVDVFVENRFTAPASISGLPAVVAGGVQVIGNAFAEAALLHIAEYLNKEGK